MSPAITAFVAAKGHSARVPGKNMRPFAGSPLFHSVLGTLAHAELVDRVVLDSDSDEILDSCAEAFPDVVRLRREPQLVGDEVPMNDLIGSCFDRTGAEVLLQTHATNPLLRSETVDAAVEAFFAAPEATSLFSVTRMQTRLYWEDLRPINHDPTELVPTQTLPVVLEENSNIYIVEREPFRRCGHRITDATTAFAMDPLEAIDIDNETDFRLAQVLHDLRHD